MTHLGDHTPLQQRPKRGLPRWLKFGIATLAFSTSIAGMLLMMWPVLRQRTSLVVDSIELISLAIAIILIGGTIASYLNRGR